MAERKIGERTYRYDRRHGAEGLRLLLRGLKIVLPLRGLVAAVLAEEGELRDAVEAQGLAELAALFDDRAAFEFIADLVRNCYEDGNLVEARYGKDANNWVLDRDEILQMAWLAVQVEFGPVVSLATNERDRGRGERRGLSMAPPEQFPPGVVFRPPPGTPS